jgi:hypothetical protein
LIIRAGSLLSMCVQVPQHCLPLKSVDWFTRHFHLWVIVFLSKPVPSLRCRLSFEISAKWIVFGTPGAMQSNAGVGGRRIEDTLLGEVV